jgi:hypothetical protein
MRVIEVDQWGASDAEGKPFDGYDRFAAVNGDAAAMVRLGIAHARILEVREDQEPSIGRVWLRKGANGQCEVYKYNYDTSD